MSKSRSKRMKIQQDGKPRKDHKVELFEREFDQVAKAIDYALAIAGKPLDPLSMNTLRVKGYTNEGLTYWTERISLGGNRWVIKVSTWIPKQAS